jgi:lipopolysaccharide transport system ATP-binding protein
MSNEIAIRIEGLGKRYQLGQTVDLKRTFRETLVDLPRFLGGKTKRLLKGTARRTLSAKRVQEFQDAVRDRQMADPDTPPGTFWALRDINLEVKHGEVVGIIGRNGAGKSTLLKILSRVTDPTAGHAEIHGRVASLLEVGTGFNPELTGRENIYLNGSILGMKKTEIDRQFDEIVAFAEVDKFLDTPVKRYSSGMYVRLAFAVAAHLQPDIQIIDEVLAVGDAAFQKKCLGKMQDVAKGGRTVLFVSHNMAMIENICNRGVLLKEGRVEHQGEISDVVSRYLDETAGSVVSLGNRSDRKGNGRVRLTDVQMLDELGRAQGTVRSGRPAAVRLQYTGEPIPPQAKMHVAVGIYNSREVAVFVVTNDLTGQIASGWPREGSVVCRFPQFLLMPGTYSMNLFVTVNDVIADWVVGAARFDVEASDFYRTGHLPPSSHGDVLMPHSWELE